MSLLKLIKIADVIEKKYLISMADGSKINFATIDCEVHYETEYYIYLAVNGSIHDKPFDYKDLKKYVVGAQEFDSINELAEELDFILNEQLFEDGKIGEEESPSLIKDYLNQLGSEEQDSWLNKVNDIAREIRESWINYRH